MRFDFCSKPSAMSVLFNENKATSAPEMSAEHNNSSSNNKIPLTIETSIVINKALKLWGPGSKNYSIS